MSAVACDASAAWRTEKEEKVGSAVAAMGHPAYDYVKLFGEDISRGMLAQRDISSGDIKQINFLQSGIDRLWYSAKKIMRRQAKSGV